MTLRARLTLVAAGVVAVVVVLASATTYFVMRHELQTQVDSSLRTSGALGASRGSHWRPRRLRRQPGRGGRLSRESRCRVAGLNLPATQDAQILDVARSRECTRASTATFGYGAGERQATRAGSPPRTCRSARPACLSEPCSSSRACSRRTGRSTGCGSSSSSSRSAAIAARGRGWPRSSRARRSLRCAG